MLTERWYPLRYHVERQRLWNSKARFRVVPAGRRSGKTEYAKRYLVQKALSFTKHSDGWFVCLAPVRDQAKRIFWDDLKKLVPKEFQSRLSESELSITLPNNAKIQVLGMDKPERVEGPPLDGAICDEYGNMKETVWSQHLSPALSTMGRPGFAWFIGVPEGKNHYYRLFQKACDPGSHNWDGFHWISADILDPEEIEDAKGRMDDLSYQQEYEASFLTFSGRAYYSFDVATHAMERLEYNSALPLVFCFDFNRSPGVAEVVQEQSYAEQYGGTNPAVADDISASIGEVYIPQNSTTPAVCRRLIKDWGHHEGIVYCYGDPTGGARGSAKVEGSDWDLIKAELRQHFGSRVKFRVEKRAAPGIEKRRVNSINSRLRTADGKIHWLVDPARCPRLVEDLEGVIVLKGGSGELDKDADEMLTHTSDAVGYYMAKRFPPYKGKTSVVIQY